MTTTERPFSGLPAWRTSARKSCSKGGLPAIFIIYCPHGPGVVTRPVPVAGPRRRFAQHLVPSGNGVPGRIGFLLYCSGTRVADSGPSGYAEAGRCVRLILREGSIGCGAPPGSKPSATSVRGQTPAGGFGISEATSAALTLARRLAAPSR
jgi:hypothetical protein